MNLFRSASLRLTLWYLAIIMALSLLFSVVLYQVSTKEFQRELSRLSSMQNSPLFVPRGFAQFQNQRLEQIAESKRRIYMNLIYFNFIILVGGGAVSYFLAKRTLEPIEQALEAQNRFTADASHELRTPLTAMKTELEVALRDKNLTFEESKALHKSNLEEVEKLEDLANSLLALAQSQNGVNSEVFETSDIQEVIHDAVRKIEPMAKTKAITIQTDLQKTMLEGDKRSLTELVTILLDNAVKYSPEKTTVTISNTIESKKSVIVVTDQGIGIRSVELPHIFDRFYRADQSRSKQNTNGYGLGLSIAKKIVDTHKGAITVESTSGKGTTFTVTLPIL